MIVMKIDDDDDDNDHGDDDDADDDAIRLRTLLNRLDKCYLVHVW